VPTRQLFCVSCSDVYLHNINFMCLARYLTKMLRFSRVCVYTFFVDDGEIIFSQKEMFCWWSCSVLTTILLYVWFRVCAIRLCFLCLRLEARRKLFRSIITRVCVWVSGFRIVTRWKLSIVLVKNRHLLFSLAHRKISFSIFHDISLNLFKYDCKM
jgi:hypothetical protein